MVVVPGDGTHKAAWILVMTMPCDGDGTHKYACVTMITMTGNGTPPDDGTYGG
jgi:hypothetical protein